MAISENNILLYRVSGRVGDLVFRRMRNGKTIVAARPKITKEPTEGMLKVRRKFKEASAYAKEALANPQRRAFYEAARSDGKNAYCMAIADFLKEPAIEDVLTDDYTGRAGGTICVVAADKFKLARVTVSIEAANGTVIESGDAGREPKSRFWYYTATVKNPSCREGRIVVNAYDLPGKMVEASREL